MARHTSSSDKHQRVAAATWRMLTELHEWQSSASDIKIQRYRQAWPPNPNPNNLPNLLPHSIACSFNHTHQLIITTPCYPNSNPNTNPNTNPNANPDPDPNPNRWLQAAQHAAYLQQQKNKIATTCVGGRNLRPRPGRGAASMMNVLPSLYVPDPAHINVPLHRQHTAFDVAALPLILNPPVTTAFQEVPLVA